MRSVVIAIAATIAVVCAVLFFGWISYYPNTQKMKALERNLHVGMSRDEVYATVKGHNAIAEGYSTPPAGESGIRGAWPEPVTDDLHPVAVVQYAVGGGLCYERDVDLWIFFDGADRLSKWEERASGSSC